MQIKSFDLIFFKKFTTNQIQLENKKLYKRVTNHKPLVFSRKL